MRLAGLEGETQRLAGAEQVLLPDHFIEGARPHPLRQRRVGLTFREQVVHAGLSPVSRLFADDVGALRRSESKHFGGNARIAFDIGKGDHRGLAELVAQFHRFQP